MHKARCCSEKFRSKKVEKNFKSLPFYRDKTPLQGILQLKLGMKNLETL